MAGPGRTIGLVAALLGITGAILVASLAVGVTGHLVRITSTLDPATLTIAPGDSVTWRNDDTRRHRVRSTSGPTEFDSGDLDPGESFTATLTVLGTYSYRDDRDPQLSNYWGTVNVAPAASPTPVLTIGPAPSQAPGDALIGMRGRAFGPATVTIAVGGHVTWLNDDDRDHTATSTAGAFDSGIMNPGASFVKTFTTAGNFAFLCLIHPDMTGTVTVLAAPGTTPPPPSPIPPATPVPTQPPADILVIDFAFTPNDLTVDAGARLTFANRGAALHTVTATDGSFDSGLLPAGATYQRVFATPGTFSFLCALHPTMTGTIRVRGIGGAPPPPPSSPTAAPPAPPGSVRIVDFAFLPGTIRVPAGTTVSWVNSGVAPHTITARDGSFDSGIVNPKGTYGRTFATPGTYAYLCAIHPDMTGIIQVADAGGQVPPPLRPPTPSVPPPPPPGLGTVRIVDLAFDPGVIQIDVGGAVEFTNVGAAIHTVTAADGSFDSGFLATGERWTRTFDVAGVVPYVCALHPSMVGSIVVGVATGSDPPGSGTGTAPPPGSGAAAGATEPPSRGPVDSGGGRVGPRSPLLTLLGAALLVGGLGGGFAVVRGVGRRAQESGTIDS